MLIVGVSENFVMPGLAGRAGAIYDLITDYAATIVFLCMVIAVIRRLVFKPARYAVPARYGKAHTADAIFLLSLIALLMLADSLFAAARAAALSHAGQSMEALATFSLPVDAEERSCLGFPAHRRQALLRGVSSSRADVLLPALLPAVWDSVPRGNFLFNIYFAKLDRGTVSRCDGASATSISTRSNRSA